VSVAEAAWGCTRVDLRRDVMTELRPDTVIRRNSRAVFRELTDGSGVLLHLESTAYHGVNPIGVLIWNLLVPEITFEELIEQLRGQLEDTPPTLAHEIAEFLHALERRDLVVLADAASER
jgi:Coenzyme PQQ synthesis protein D (PqqD)